MSAGSGISSVARWLFFVAVAAMMVYYFNVPPAEGFMEPELARIVIFHLPCAFVCTVYVIVASVFSINYLRKRQMVWEHRAAAASAVALATGCATMATGIVFSKAQWGDWWHWDPRQTSFLIVLLLLGAYFGVRMAYDEPVIRARAAAAYSTISLLPVLMLIFVVPRIAQVADKSLHPTNTIQSGGFSPEYWVGVSGLFLLLLVFTTWLYRLHVRVSLLEEKVIFNDATLNDTHGSDSDSGVVRPVRVRE